jgi:integrase
VSESRRKGNERTGTIEWRDEKAYARVRVTMPNGEIKRKRVPLNTRDPKTAERKLAKLNRLIERGELVLDEGAKPVDVTEEFGVLALQIVADRKAESVAMAGDEKINLEKHILSVETEGSAFGAMCLADIRPRHVVAVLASAIAKGLSKGTIGHIKRLVSRIFRAAIARDLLPPGANPVDAAKTPRMSDEQTVEKDFVILTDEEIERFIASPKVDDIEIKMMSLASRIMGGMRGREIKGWSWDQIDTVNFAMCKMQRAKTKKFQTLEIPETLRPFLAAWWQKSGGPKLGPVFPVTKGPRKGEFRKARGASFAKRLRRALRVAGLTRPELYVETASTKPVNFHSFRRAFASALADANVSTATAMVLTHHSDPKVHEGYVRKSARMRVIPDAAIPRLNAGNTSESGPLMGPPSESALGDAENLSGKRGSNPRPSAWEADALPTELLPQRSPHGSRRGFRDQAERRRRAATRPSAASESAAYVVDPDVLVVRQPQPPLSTVSSKPAPASSPVSVTPLSVIVDVPVSSIVVEPVSSSIEPVSVGSTTPVSVGSMTPVSTGSTPVSVGGTMPVSTPASGTNVQPRIGVFLQPLVVSHVSVVQGLPSSHDFVVEPHAPVVLSHVAVEHASGAGHALGSCLQPTVASHESVVHASLSSQLIAVPFTHVPVELQTPAKHLSNAHVAPACGFAMQVPVVVVGSHALTRHGLPDAGQVFVVPPHLPTPSHTSPVVHTFESLQVVPLGTG